MPDTATSMVSADTDDLGLFTERGARYVDGLLTLTDEVDRARLAAVAALGYQPPGPVAPLAELAAEATVNNLFVGEIADALWWFGVALGPVVDHRLRSIGLPLDGRDAGVEEDLAMALAAAWDGDDPELTGRLLVLGAVTDGAIGHDDALRLVDRPPELIAAVLDGRTTVAEALTATTPDGDLQAIQGWLADDWRGVTEHDLNRIRDRLDAAAGWQVDWILGSLSERDRTRLFDNVESSGFWSNDWSDATRNRFYVMVGEKVSLRTWAMIGGLTESVDPDPATALPDSARDDDDQARVEWYEALLYGDFSLNPLSDRGADGHGIGFDDPSQGGIGDCYFVAAMIAVAGADPELLDGIIHANPNGTYTVTFGDGTEQVVSPSFPVHPDAVDRPVFTNPNRGAEREEIWPALLEKAYAQRHGSWGEIVGGWPGEAVAELTGFDNERLKPDDLDLADLQQRYDDGQIMTIATITTGDLDNDEWLALDTTPDPFKITGDQGLKPRHAFVVTEVDAEAGTVTVVNPWYPHRTPIELDFDDLVDSIQVLEVNAQS